MLRGVGGYRETVTTTPIRPPWRCTRQEPTDEDGDPHPDPSEKASLARDGWRKYTVMVTTAPMMPATTALTCVVVELELTNRKHPQKRI